MSVTAFFSDNWSIISPIIWGIVGAMIAYNTVALITNAILATQAIMEGSKAAAQAMATGATFAETAAQYGLNAALYACPITWIIGAIILLIVIFYAAIGAVNKFAKTSYSATGMIAGAFMATLAFIGNYFVATGNLIIDIVALIWNTIASFAEFFANVFNDPVGSVVRLFSSMADSILSILQSIASAVDTIFGSNLAGAVSGWRGQLQGMTNDLVGEAKIVVPKMDAQSLHFKRYEYGAAYKAGHNFGKGIEEKFNPSNLLKNNFDLDNYGGSIKATADNTGAMKDSMKISEEDLKYLRDVAEQEAVNRFTTAQIKVDMTNHNNIKSDMDLDGVVAHLEKKVEDAMIVAAEGVHE
jgi:hypothetical protein